MKKALSWIGVALLVFLASALVFTGLAISLRTQDPVDPRDTSVPFEGFLMVTLGIGIAVAASPVATKWGWTKPVEDVLGFVLSFFGISALLSLIMSVWEQHRWPAGLPPSGLVWFALAVLETMAALVWLLTKARRARKNPDGMDR
jgi:predicted small integral membrane protein